eukprot:7815530-Prorocentrum_lima.AAC.1
MAGQSLLAINHEGWFPWLRLAEPRRLLNIMKGDDTLHKCGTHHQHVMIKRQLGRLEWKCRVTTSGSLHHHAQV